MDEHEIWERRLQETLEMLKHVKPKPEPVNVLPPLPLTRDRAYKPIRNVEFRSVKGHWEVYINGRFQCSADTKAEAWREVWGD